MNKKPLILLYIFILIVSLIGCGDKKVNSINLLQEIQTSPDDYGPEVNSPLNLTVLLKGAIDTVTGEMRTSLRDLNYLPATDPYGNGKTLHSSISTGTGANRPVDWVLVELRKPSNPSQVVYSKAGILLKSGKIVNSTPASTNSITSVSSTQIFNITAAQGNYYISIKHRNHLRVFSSTFYKLSETNTSIDFTAAETFKIGSQQVLNSGKWAMIPGDVNSDGRVIYTGPNNDRDLIQNLLGIDSSKSGYYNEDTTLDGIVLFTGNLNDRDIILVTIGGSNPNTIISEISL